MLFRAASLHGIKKSCLSEEGLNGTLSLKWTACEKNQLILLRKFSSVTIETFKVVCLILQLSG